ncbi:MAG TPA: hypothetical protein VGR85_15610 [Candidatus Limnocylindria bacterium]|nr:hypothetical protein [Candidatus Limnocylindria bacterium]
MKVDDKLHDNDKLGSVSDAAFRLWVLALSWSNDKLTDGHIPTSRPLKLLVLRNAQKTIEDLLEARLWHRASSPCKSCIAQREDKNGDPIPSGGYVIHDYFLYQRAAWVIRAERDKNVRAGRRSGEVRREQSVEQNGQHSVERSAERSVQRSVEHTVERSVEPRTPYPRNPVPKSDSSSYQAPDEPEIPDEPERSNDRKGRGMRNISGAARRATADAARRTSK